MAWGHNEDWDGKEIDTDVWPCYFYKSFIMLHTSKHNKRQTEQMEVQTKLIVKQTTVNNCVNRHPKIGVWQCPPSVKCICMHFSATLLAVACIAIKQLT